MSDDQVMTPDRPRLPRRIVIGCILAALSVVIFQMTLLLPVILDSANSGIFHQLLMFTVPAAAGFACIALSISQIAMGCIDYARAPRG